MNYRAARLTLAAVIALASMLNVVGPPTSAVAEHLPPPSEIVLRASELPADFAPANEAGAPSLLPDGLARQATVSYRRAPELAAEPGVSYIKQVVLAFDDREATEYMPRFRDLMLKHQGYSAVSGTESEFQLARTRAGETSIVVGTARAEVMVVTTVAGQAGTVSAENATRLTSLAVARVPVIDQSSAALSTSPSGGLALGNANPGGSHFDFPSIEEANRWPEPSARLPKPQDLDVVAPRSQRPVGDPSLNGLVDVHPNRARPADLETNLVKYVAWIVPLIDEFWARALGETGFIYYKPRIVMVNEGIALVTPCIEGDGYPSLALDLSYCPANKTIYIYEPFLRDEIVSSENWHERDFVITAMLAHEWGHHIQSVHNYAKIEAFNAANTPDQAPFITRASELQADCYAGLFTRYARDAGWIDGGDLREAQDGMMRVGDTDFESPGHHGTPEQRREWFMRGYIHYSLRACDAW